MDNYVHLVRTKGGNRGERKLGLTWPDYTSFKVGVVFEHQSYNFCN